MPHNTPLKALPLSAEHTRQRLKKSPTQLPFLRLLLAHGVLAFALFLGWQWGFIQSLFRQDASKISFVIVTLSGGFSLFALWRAWWLGQQQETLSMQRFGHVSTGLETQLENHFQGPHEWGWFAAGMMIKLGLIGTVIGFINMLAAVDALQSFDLEQMQFLMQDMSHGMGVALYTTLTGIAASLWLGGCYLTLDRAAEGLISDALSLYNDVRQGV